MVQSGRYAIGRDPTRGLAGCVPGMIPLVVGRQLRKGVALGAESCRLENSACIIQPRRSPNRGGLVRRNDPIARCHVRRVVTTLKGHHSEITGVIYFPDGQRILSAELDGSVKIWDAIAGRELMTLIDRMRNSGLAA